MGQVLQEQGAKQRWKHTLVMLEVLKGEGLYTLQPLVEKGSRGYNHLCYQSSFVHRNQLLYIENLKEINQL